MKATYETLNLLVVISSHLKKKCLRRILVYLRQNIQNVIAKCNLSECWQGTCSFITLSSNLACTVLT